ncbi:MAG TPA: hypothetical protein VHC01_01680 [Gaiellaceae bacterium]|jgi:hypothetical protein|nr:hypothetical protein [Gaiellaceae bacterium]
MDALQRFLAGIPLLVRRHSPRVWLLWALAAALLVLTPFALLDPAGWAFLVDPELAAIVALLGLGSVRTGALRVLRLSRLRRSA